MNGLFVAMCDLSIKLAAGFNFKKKIQVCHKSFASAYYLLPHFSAQLSPYYLLCALLMSVPISAEIKNLKLLKYLAKLAQVPWTYFWGIIIEVLLNVNLAVAPQHALPEIY